jgi:DNA helicase-2/ATP-dependent DNA helicase PcrA
MPELDFTIEDLWADENFTPNENQRRAILHTDGPLYLPAGPGSGKTRVLLWRTLNLIVFHDVPPEDIYLSTFTEKAALQLREGLQGLLGAVTNRTGRYYDHTQLYVGTVHSLCQRLITDRRFAEGRERIRPPQLLDELGQYFHLHRKRNWRHLLQSVGLDPEEDIVTLHKIFEPGFKYDSTSRHNVISECIAFFNRVSEECIDPREALLQLQTDDPELVAFLAEHNIDPDGLALLYRLYTHYREGLAAVEPLSLTDFALLQRAAYRRLQACPGSEQVFQHVIVDEYQDTNTIQERLFFKLAAGHGNLCVVGDDDQALYRFRGATVENFVRFPRRCQQYLDRQPTTIPLDINYRSRAPIVDFYTDFIQGGEWQVEGEHYRVPKDIRAHRQDTRPAVVTTPKGKLDEGVAEALASFVQDLIASGKVKDPNQVAFLFSSLKSKCVPVIKAALEAQGLEVYAPRAGRFLAVPEAIDVFGIFLHIFGMPPHNPNYGGDYGEFVEWMRAAQERGAALMEADAALTHYIEDRRQEIATAVADLEALERVVERHHWDPKAVYDRDVMRRPLHEAAGLSDRAQSLLGSSHFDRIAQRRQEEGEPFTLDYIITRATSLDWNVLDVFYRLCGFRHFRVMFNLAQSGKDEGPVYNLAYISQFLARFIDEYTPLISAHILSGGMFKLIFFMSYLYSLFRRRESEYEDAEDPFPKGRIPFITIHQSKGLEFPVVVLPTPRRYNHGVRRVELFTRPFLDREPGEPLDHQDDFDSMRLFYVALSRAKNLLVLGAASYYTGTEFRKLYKQHEVPRLSDFDLATLPKAQVETDDLPQTYSYTADYSNYQKCPRQYMIFRKYGFTPSRTQMMFFGTLIHRTLEDLHNYLIAQREEVAG